MTKLSFFLLKRSIGNGQKPREKASLRWYYMFFPYSTAHFEGSTCSSKQGGFLQQNEKLLDLPQTFLPWKLVKLWLSHHSDEIHETLPFWQPHFKTHTDCEWYKKDATWYLDVTWDKDQNYSASTCGFKKKNHKHRFSRSVIWTDATKLPCCCQWRFAWRQTAWRGLGEILLHRRLSVLEWPSLGE